MQFIWTWHGITHTLSCQQDQRTGSKKNWAGPGMKSLTVCQTHKTRVGVSDDISEMRPSWPQHLTTHILSNQWDQDGNNDDKKDSAEPHEITHFLQFNIRCTTLSCMNKFSHLFQSSLEINNSIILSDLKWHPPSYLFCHLYAVKFPFPQKPL